MVVLSQLVGILLSMWRTIKMSKKRPLEIDMCAGSQLRDTQGEMLSIEGADISELKKLNDNHGKGFFNSIGIVTYSKKIFKKEDCENERQEYYWDKVKAPYIYVRGFLHDDEDHPNAKAAAAILRNLHKHDVPLQLKASVEGGVISRGIKDKSFLAKTKIHSVALTFTPANNNTLVEPIELQKSNDNFEADMLLIKSVMHLAETNVPSFRHIARDASATKVQKNLEKIVTLMEEFGVSGQIIIPSKKQILEKALQDKIKNNIAKINKEIKNLKKPQEELDKGLKQNIGAAMIASSSLMPGAGSLSSKQTAPIVQQATETAQQPKKSAQQVWQEVLESEPHLGAIGFIESSGGKNFNHKTMTSGIHKDHTAGGIFGIMPNSVNFIFRKDKELAKKYPEIAEKAKDIKNNHKHITELLNNEHEISADIAKSMFNYHKQHTVNPNQLIYSWNQGLKGSWNHLKDHGQDHIDSHDYVKKVNDFYEKNQNRSIASDKVKKSLTAGYGGAGAPTSLTGGSVLQSESLDDGRSKLRYISCDSCGKEQVHGKYQVKCRHCGRNFSLEKLVNLVKHSKN
jgi:hypothetical protein